MIASATGYQCSPRSLARSGVTGTEPLASRLMPYLIVIPSPRRSTGGLRRQGPGTARKIVCEAVIGRLGRLPRPERIIHDTDREPGPGRAAVGQASLEDVEVKVARELSACGWSEWMRPSTRALTFGRAV